MKKSNKKMIFVFLLMILLILKLIFFDRNVFSIVFDVTFLGFFLLTSINYFRKKESNLEKNYLKIMLLFLVLANVVQTGILLFSGKNIVNSLFNVVVYWMMLNSSTKLLKKDFNAKKVFVAAVLLVVVPYFKNLNLELLSNVIISLLLAIYFNNCKDNYFGLFDPSLINSDKKKFKFTQWIKTILIILVGIIFLYLPILGSVLTVILWFFCFGGFFDNLILVYEQKLFSKKLRKNKEFIACRNIYNLVPGENDYIKTRMDVVAKKTFLEVGIPYEVYALMEINGSRKYESIKELVLDDEDSLLDEVKKLFKEKMRPEVICQMLVGALKKHKKACTKIEKETNKFNEKILKTIDEEIDVFEKQKQVRELYDEYQEDILEIVSSL